MWTCRGQSLDQDLTLFIWNLGGGTRKTMNILVSWGKHPNNGSFFLNILLDEISRAWAWWWSWGETGYPSRLSYPVNTRRLRISKVSSNTKQRVLGRLLNISSWLLHVDTYPSIYPLVNIQKGYWKSPSSIGKSTINGPFSITMSN